MAGLIWEVKTNDSSIYDINDRYTWQKAQDVFVAQLNSNNFGGHSDWRLPSIKELSTIADKAVANPAINTAYFPNIMLSPEGYSQGHFGSSTPYVNDITYAWYVNFLNGDIGCRDGVSNLKHVRAARGGQKNGQLLDNGDGPVTDTRCSSFF